MFKKLSVTILLVATLFMSITACDKNIDKITDETTKRKTPVGTNEPFTIIIPENRNVSGTNLVLMLDLAQDPTKYDPANNMKYIEDIKTQLDDKNFDINIDIVTCPSSGSIEEKYKEYVKTKISSGGNVAFISEYFSKEEIKEMVNNGQIMELSGIFEKYAPGHYMDIIGNSVVKNYIKNSSKCFIIEGQDKIYGIPVGSAQYLDYPALLVRKDIAEKYGKDIDTFDDYETLLKWVYKNAKQYKTGLFFLPDDKITEFANDYPIYDLFAHANGYSNIDGLIGKFNGADFYFKNTDIEEVIKNKGVDIVTASEIPGFKEFILKFGSLMNYNSFLLYSWPVPYTYPLDPYIFASIYTNTLYYLQPDLLRYRSVFINADDYVMFLFNKDGLVQSASKQTEYFTSALYISSNTKNPEEILRFIEWLYGNRNNYNQFIYGEEGVDYEINNERMEFKENYRRTYWGDNQLAYFKTISLDSIKSYHPSNWDEILKEISKVPDINETSLYGYVNKNTEIKSDELNDFYNSINTYSGSLITQADKEAYINGTRDFGYAFQTYTGSELEEIIDRYIGDVANMKIIQEEKGKYEGFINKLLGYLKE